MPSQMVVAPWQLEVDGRDWIGFPDGVRYRKPYGANNDTVEVPPIEAFLAPNLVILD